MPGTQIVVTANTAGGGDTRGRCISSNVIDASILDRFERALEFHWMDWKYEEPIAKEKFPFLLEKCPSVFAQVGKATDVLRTAIMNEKLYAEFSHRALCAWLGHAQDLLTMSGGVVQEGLMKRAFRAYSDKLPDQETRSEALRLIDPHIAGGVVDTGRAPRSRRT